MVPGRKVPAGAFRPRKDPDMRQQILAGTDEQIRFNHGFHDGAADARARRKPMWTSPHFDRVYESGHDAGVAAVAAGADTDTSAFAWAEFYAIQRQVAPGTIDPRD